MNTRAWNLIFGVVTVTMVAVIAMCIGLTVKSKESTIAVSAEDLIQKQEVLDETREYLNTHGYRNGGVSVTYRTYEDGSLTYVVSMHHRRFDEMDEDELYRLEEELRALWMDEGAGSKETEYVVRYL